MYLQQFFQRLYFQLVFLDSTGSIQLEDNPKILAAIIATIVGVLSRNIIATIFSGLISYWTIIFVL